ncbi:MAG: DUF1801 domain-containing protein [Chitinophagaceae bacterium]
MTPLDNFYMKQEEPIKSCFLALKQIILMQHNDITNVWKYGGSFFALNGKAFCYLWVHKKLQQPYIGFMKGYAMTNPNLLSEKRTQIKIMLFDTNNDLPITEIKNAITEAIELCKK